MENGESRDGEIIRLEENARFDLMQVKRNGWLRSTQDDTIKQIIDAVERPLSAVDIYLLDRFPAHKG